MVFAICMASWNVVYCLRMCMTTNSKPFSTWFYFNNFVDVKFCGTGFTVLLHVSDWKACFGECDVYFNNVCMAEFFTEIWMTLLSEFDAPARCTSTKIKARQHGTAADR